MWWWNHYSLYHFESVVYLNTILVAIACSLLGVYLILNKMSMLIDAISHSVFLGIVVAYIFVKMCTSIEDPLKTSWLMIGATMMAIFSAYFSRFLTQNRTVKEDAAIGIVFSFLFSLATIIVSIRLKGVHLDMDSVFLGDLAMIGESKIFQLLLVLILNLLFLILFYKELKLVAFDKLLAQTLGVSPFIINYLLLSFISFTSVVSFDAAGSILIISLIIGPPVIALNLANQISHCIFISVFISLVSAHLGYCLAVLTNLPISGLIVSIILFLFCIVLFFEPKKGVIAKIISLRIKRINFGVINLLMHIENNKKQNKNTHFKNTQKELKWIKGFYNKCVKKSLKLNYLRIKNEEFYLTSFGKEFLLSKNEEFFN